MNNTTTQREEMIQTAKSLNGKICDLSAEINRMAPGSPTRMDRERYRQQLRERMWMVADAVTVK